jgi:hypothetical protein
MSLTFTDNYSFGDRRRLRLGKYYLIDSGYPNWKSFLSPYKGETYHLLEF